jgi:hypothetical protein
MNTVNGLPAHILLVHAVVVLLPLAAVLLVLTAWWEPARRRLAAANAILAIAVVLIIPITTSAGEWLERRVPQTNLLHDHTELGDTAIWYAIPIAVLAVVVWWRQREATVAETPATANTGIGGRLATMTRQRTYLKPESRTVMRVIAVLAVVLAVVGVYGIYLIGDSGSKAAWTGNFSATSTDPGPGRRPR